MASAEHEPIRGSEGRAPPPEAESILVIGCPTEPANLAPVRENSMLCYGVLVSELGGRVHGAPQPRHWGACAPLLPAPPRLRRLCSEHQRFRSEQGGERSVIRGHFAALRRRRQRVVADASPQSAVHSRPVETRISCRVSWRHSDADVTR